MKPMKLTKKEQIEQIATELFWKHGFKKVTIDEICKKANVSRKTFYTFFENKTALVIFLMNKLTEEAFVESQQIMNGDYTFEEKLEKSLQLKLQRNKDMSMEFVADFYNPDAAEILKCFNEIMGRSIVMLVDFLKNAQQSGDINPNLNLNYVLWLMQKQVEFCSSPELMHMFPDVDTLTRQLTQTLIYGIMPVK
ncbi:MAG: TetR/AcrR family transcriptional regulator [Paludibacter sp.]